MTIEKAKAAQHTVCGHCDTWVPVKGSGVCPGCERRICPNCKEETGSCWNYNPYAGTVDRNGKKTYTDGQLRAIKRKYLRECHPEEYRQMAKDGELAEYLESCAKSARDYAESLVHTGMWEVDAWRTAIREELLDTPAD